MRGSSAGEFVGPLAVAVEGVGDAAARADSAQALEHGAAHVQQDEKIEVPGAS
jgi:hypothetical protein